MSAYDDELEAAYVRAIWERNAAVHAAETRSFESYKARMIECELREALAFESAFRVVLYFAVAVTLVALFTALPVHAEPATLTAARTAQVTCVQREYRTRTASAGVSATEAALVARAQAEHACALEAWSRALGAAAEVRVVTATRAPVVIERVGDTAYVSTDRGLTWREVLSHGGACALCGGGVALGAWAACGGVR